MEPSARSLDVLCVNQYFPPDTSATAAVMADLVGGLVDAGHEVKVVAGRPSYRPERRLPWQIVSRRSCGAARVSHVGSTAFDRSSFPGRLTNYASYLGLSTLRGFLRSPPDVVVCGSDPPLALLPAIAAAGHAPVVYSLRDLHPDMAVASDMIHDGPAVRWWDRLHVEAMRQCARVVCLGGTMADRVCAKGVPEPQIEVIHDGATMPTGDPFPDVVRELRGQADFVAMHAGNLGGAGPWDTLTAAREQLTTGVDIRFVGEGVHASRVRASGATVMPFRPPSEIPSVMAAGDLQIVAQRPSMVGLVIPSKLFTALAHHRPILAVAPAESEVARIVDRYDCGLLADPDRPNEVAEKITWASRHPQELQNMVAGVRQAAERFDRRRLQKQFVETVEAVANMHGEA